MLNWKYIQRPLVCKWLNLSYETRQFMFYREIIAVCPQTHTTHSVSTQFIGTQSSHLACNPPITTLHHAAMLRRFSKLFTFCDILLRLKLSSTLAVCTTSSLCLSLCASEQPPTDTHSRSVLLGRTPAVCRDSFQNF